MSILSQHSLPPIYETLRPQLYTPSQEPFLRLGGKSQCLAHLVKRGEDIRYHALRKVVPATTVGTRFREDRKVHFRHHSRSGTGDGNFSRTEVGSNPKFSLLSLKLLRSLSFSGLEQRACFESERRFLQVHCDHVNESCCPSILVVTLVFRIVICELFLDKGAHNERAVFGMQKRPAQGMFECFRIRRVFRNLSQELWKVYLRRPFGVEKCVACLVPQATNDDQENR